MKLTNKNAMNFLLYTYFGITEKSNCEEIIKAAVNRAYLDAASHVLSIIEGNDNFRKSGADEIKNAVQGYSNNNNSYDEWHYSLCTALTKYEEEVTYGIAQKWVNMTMKYLWLLDALPSGIHSEELHIPIDSYVIDALWEFDTVTLPPKEKYNRSFKYKTPSSYVIPWSYWDDYDAYVGLQREAKAAIADKFNIAPIEWEAEAWVEIAKKRSTK